MEQAVTVLWPLQGSKRKETPGSNNTTASVLAVWSEAVEVGELEVLLTGHRNDLRDRRAHPLLVLPNLGPEKQRAGQRGRLFLPWSPLATLSSVSALKIPQDSAASGSHWTQRPKDEALGEPFEFPHFGETHAEERHPPDGVCQDSRRLKTARGTFAPPSLPGAKGSVFWKSASRRGIL
ncbi:hypothetical protein AAFF_G00344250 [Aldrovandia affinis]|uniref:Uncharacterized protein n=1 Tax=Aldrovandia affinis TaxID=143900 RepID=A0AAD7SK11_9TELE|nr:hypothetical protein AAFF_G00344250 [Aldrovandia affinis]